MHLKPAGPTARLSSSKLTTNNYHLTSLSPPTSTWTAASPTRPASRSASRQCGSTRQSNSPICPPSHRVSTSGAATATARRGPARTGSISGRASTTDTRRQPPSCQRTASGSSAIRWTSSRSIGSALARASSSRRTSRRSRAISSTRATSSRTETSTSTGKISTPTLSTGAVRRWRRAKLRTSLTSSSTTGMTPPTGPTTTPTRR